MVSFSGTDHASRQWRRDQMDISSDYEGLPKDPHISAFVATLDKLDLSDAQRIEALQNYFVALSREQGAAAA